MLIDGTLPAGNGKPGNHHRHGRYDGNMPFATIKNGDIHLTREVS